MVSFSALLTTAATITGLARAHSWIHCSDYRGDAAYYEPENCFGHPRPVGGRVPQMTTFGVDTGYNAQPNTSCQDVAADPLNGFPMARYQQGQQVTLAWPSKNHVAATCTNPFIPDTSLELFVAAHDQDGHPDDFVKVSASFSEDPHVDKTIDFKGFQNCPAFCENTDKSLCTGSFFVPSMLPDGIYTFQWKWVFNAGTAPYITCFEAYVGQDVSPVAVPTPMPTAIGFTPPPTVEATQDNCTVGMWGQCSESACCAGGVTCFKQSNFYSQCRPDCPSGWECAGAVTPSPVPSPTPVPSASTPSPVESPTPTPVQSPTPAPTEQADCAAVVDVNVCRDGFGSRGKLQKGRGAFAFTANVATPCECAHFCKLFNPTAAAWMFKETNQKCTCYVSAKKVKKSKDSWAGMILDLAGTNL